MTSLAVSHDGQCVLAARMDSRLKLLEKGSGEQLATYTGHKHEGVKLDCALTPSDEFVACGSEDGHVFFWDLVEEKLVRKIAAHKGVVCSLAIHPDSDCLLTSSTDGTVAVWK